MNAVEQAKNALAEAIAESCFMAMKDAGFDPSDTLREKITEEIYFSIRLGR